MRNKAYNKERDESLLSLDKEKILAFCAKYNLYMPTHDISFWAGIHKAILQISSASDGQKQVSREWLLSHGFSTSIPNRLRCN